MLRDVHTSSLLLQCVRFTVSRFQGLCGETLAPDFHRRYILLILQTYCASAMVEKNPWWHNVSGPFLVWQGPVGVKEDGGGCTRGHGRVGNMVIHRAVCNKDLEGELGCLRERAGSD